MYSNVKGGWVGKVRRGGEINQSHTIQGIGSPFFVLALSSFTHHLDTIWIHFQQNGQKQDAIRTLEKAERFDPSHGRQLKQWRSETLGN